ncbi:hypothetical protein BLA29_002958, partial [Euroglyphus maynei]
MQERAICSGINADPVTIYRSHIQYHQNSPKWFEHLKVNVPLEQFEMAHLRFTFCHCSSKERERKFLGFSFLPLADKNGACLSDGEHELYIYKYQVFDSLQRLGRVPGEEMVKFLEDILDALFALFTMTTVNNVTTITDSNNLSPRTLSIFRVLIDFFKTLNDPKFVSYRSALEKYIEKQFSAPLVYYGLITCVRRYVEMVIVSIQQTNNERTSIDSSSSSSSTIVTKRDLEFILRCLSVLDWILKIIVQSRILYTRASIAGNLIVENSNLQNDDEFKMELLLLFETIQRLLHSE